MLAKSGTDLASNEFTINGWTRRKVGKRCSFGPVWFFLSFFPQALGLRSHSAYQPESELCETNSKFILKSTLLSFLYIYPNIQQQSTVKLLQYVVK